MGSPDWGGKRLPGLGFGLATFPGVVLHEAGHVVFCLLTGTRVTEVCFFQFAEPMGYVRHEPPTSVYKSILIGVGPFLFSTLAAFGFGLLLAGRYPDMEAIGFPGYVLLWLGISVGTNSFPSTGDAQCIWFAVWREPGTPWPAKLIGTPLVGIIYLGALGSILWLNLVYGVLVGAILPHWALYAAAP